MKVLVVDRNIIVSMFAVMLLMFGLQDMSYGEVLLTEPNSEMDALLLYWTEDAGSSSTIRRMDLINGEIQDVATGLGSLPPSDIAVDASGGKVYWSDDFLADKIQRANLDGTDRQDVVGGLSPTGIGLDVSGGKVYWVDDWEGKIQRADLDGANVEDVVTGLDDPTDVAIDVSGGKIYWTDDGTGKIRRADLDGANVEDVVTGLDDPTYIDINVSGGKIYWVDDGTGKIQRANLDGTDIKDVVTGFIWSIGIALDVSGGKIYWTNTVKKKIQRSDLDGANVEDVVTELKISTLFPAISFAAIPDKTTLSLTPTSAPSSATVRVSPAAQTSPAIGQQLTIALKVADGNAVAGYQATVEFDTTALRYVESSNGDYLSGVVTFVPPIEQGNLVKLNAASGAGEADGDGTLATLTFEVVAVKASTLMLSDVLFVNSAGEKFTAKVENGQMTAPSFDLDVNGDGSVNIQDLVMVVANIEQTGTHAADVNGDKIVDVADLVLIADALAGDLAAPAAYPQALRLFTASEIQAWLSEARHLSLTDAASQRGILFLEQLLTALTPEETLLLPNFPNPFNPETWIPYQLSKPADVTISIYAANGQVVRRLALGHQAAGIYKSRSRAAYWDGRNAFCESVASGIYFYTLTIGDFTATRKMLIRK